jgi:hypothetical protein
VTTALKQVRSTTFPALQAAGNGGGDNGNRTRVNGFAVPAVSSGSVRLRGLHAPIGLLAGPSGRQPPALLLPVLLPAGSTSARTFGRRPPSPRCRDV